MTRRTSVVTSSQLIEQFNAVVTDMEQLLKSVLAAGGEKAGALRAKAERGLENSKDRMRELQQAAADKVEMASNSTDEYVHEHPWQAIGAAAGLALAASVLIGLLLNRG